MLNSKGLSDAIMHVCLWRVVWLGVG